MPERGEIVKIRETRKVPATKKEVVVATVCDLCKRKYRYEGWNQGLYEREETEISYESGEVYPEGGSTEVISYDICPKCFKEKLMPWLESQGAEHNLEERDW